MSDIDILAHVIQGETGGLCPFAAMVLIGYLWGLDVNRTFYGWATPSDVAIAAATHWMWFPHPAPGARFLFGRADLPKPAVQRLIAGRGPPLAVWNCAGGLQLIAY